MEKYCISVDWLSVCCYGNQLKPCKKMTSGQGNVWSVRLSGNESKVFTSIFEIYQGERKIAVVSQNPRSSVLKKNITIIKLENRVLYTTKYIELLYDIMATFRLVYKGITRIDIAYDCNKFANGRNPARFIQDFVMKPVDSLGGIYMSGTTRFDCHGSRSASSSSKITSISYGSRENAVCRYMYDKTLELKEVKDKPWIREMWSLNGLVSDERTHVWRSEISIKCEGKDLLNMQTGQLFQLSPTYLKHYDKIVQLFHFYAKKYFDFRVNTGQKTKRHFKPLFLFDSGIDITCKPISISTLHDSGRMEKICYNKLKRLSEEYVDMSSYIRTSLGVAMDFLSNLSGVKLAITREQAYTRYLDTLKGCKFLNELDYIYLETIQQAWDSRKELAAMYMYDQAVIEFDDYASWCEYNAKQSLSKP